MLDLPLARRLDSSQGAVGGRARVALSTAETIRLHDLGRRLGVTPFMTVVAGFAVVLSRWSGQTDLVIGAPVSTRSHVGTDDLIGFFVNTLPLRVDLAGAPTFAGLLDRVRDTVTEAYGGNAETPFDMVVKELQLPRDPVRTPLFQAIVNMLEDAEADLQLPGLEVEVGETPALPKMFDLSMTVREHRGALSFDLTFYADRYQPEAMQALLDQVAGVLVATSNDPERTITDYELRGPGPVEVPDDDPAWSPEALSRSVRAFASQDADQTAIADADGRWTYGELDRAADQVANGLTASVEAPVLVVRRDGGALAAALVGCARAARTWVVVPGDQVAFHPGAAVLDPDALERRAGSGSRSAAAAAAEAALRPEPAAVDGTRGWALTGDDRVGVLGGSARHLGLALMAGLRAGAELHFGLGTFDDPASTVLRIRQAGVTALFVTGPELRALLPYLGDEPGLAVTQVVVDQAGDLLAHDVEDLNRAQPGARWVST